VSKPKQGDSIAVWFSCGAASAVAAKQTIELYGDICKIHIVNNPVKEEHADNQRFLKDVEKWLGIEIEFAINEKYPNCSAVEVWEKRKYMSGIAGAPCTVQLKKEARYQWEVKNKVDWHVLGFTFEEKSRSDNFIKGERENLLPVLLNSFTSKLDCLRIIQQAGIELPEIYKLGYPNANCIGCVKATSPTYWNHVRLQHPRVFDERAKQSKRLGVRLVRVNNKRVFLEELKTTDTGAPLKGMDFECGLFCEEDV